MKTLEQPTGNLPTIQGKNLFEGTLKDMHNSVSAHLNGAGRVLSADLDIMYVSNDLTLSKCLKMIRSYYRKMKEDHPAREEFNTMAIELATALIYSRSLDKEFKVSRQRNLDLELIIIRMQEEAKQKDSEIERLRKQNESLIAGL